MDDYNMEILKDNRIELGLLKVHTVYLTLFSIQCFHYLAIPNECLLFYATIRLGFAKFSNV